MDTNIELQNAVESFSNGKKESFNQIYELSYRYLHTCVIHVVKDEDIAMDVLQDTYLEVSKSIVQLKNKEGFLNWTATIANRKCYAYLRNQKDILLYDNEDDDESDDFFENIADNEEFIPETVLQNREKQRLIKEIIYGLTDIQRLCVIGFYYNEQKQEEIAQELGIPVNTVKSHLNRAKAKIKEAVVELDKKKGTRLYSMAPFMLLLFKEEVKACVLKPMSAALALEVGASTSSGGISGAIKDAIAKVKSLWTKAAPAVKTKVVVGAAVGTVAISGAAVTLSQPEGDKISVEYDSAIYQPGVEAQKGTTKESETEKYMVYEEFEPIKMYVRVDGNETYEINYADKIKPERLSFFRDIYAGEEVLVDAKTTWYGQEFYRLALSEDYPQGWRFMINAKALVDELPENMVKEEGEETGESNLTIEGNSGSLTTETQEYEEKYITYEDMEPTTMYVILYCDIYPDVNATEGVLEIEDSIEAGEAVIIDGKGTFNGGEFYRIQRPEDSVNPYSSIIPAKALSLEKPVEAEDEEDQDLWFNGGSYVGTLREVEQKYMKYEDMEPTTMYVINNPDIQDENEIYSVYNDPNVTEGALMVGGIVEASAEILIDGKGVYEGVEYYRIAYKEGTMLDFQLIVPAECLTAEKIK